MSREKVDGPASEMAQQRSISSDLGKLGRGSALGEKVTLPLSKLSPSFLRMITSHIQGQSPSRLQDRRLHQQGRAEDGARGGETRPRCCAFPCSLCSRSGDVGRGPDLPGGPDGCTLAPLLSSSPSASLGLDRGISPSGEAPA